MAVLAPYPADWDDQEFYPLHEEDDVPEIPRHEATTRYLRDAVAARFPAWFVTGDVCIYWEPGNTTAYRAPDVLVVTEPLTEEVYRVYQTWKQPPVAFVAEIGSRSTFREDEGPNVELYQDLVRVREYYYADPPNGLQRLWRLGPAGLQEVTPEANGRLRGRELGLEFALEGDGVRLYTLTGEVLLDHVETEAAWREAEATRQEAEAQRAEEARLREEAEAGQAEETRRRQEAEARQAEEARRRQEAEAQRAEEARRRQEAEARVAELERLLAERQAPPE